MTPELHPAIGKNRYCGPGALAILTGCSTDAASALLRDVSGKRYIKRTANRHMIDALAKTGSWAMQVTPLYRSVGPTLRSWAVKQSPGRFLVQVTGHYVVVRVEDGVIEVCDNQSVYPLPVERFKRGGKHVKRAWRIAA